ncbi:hypothetical protein BDU57DRAFT_539504 [Ampelomyces quisqualis]|uniref:Uncharacterized protein n=1 Tax=Ampelomyces quisqualis TaxID=50730 RepID=A0A6A5QIC0_AMPQU|nr:hypothetical protein BDU57DRAFT_539504 [Ampelomyces quisqualis]
MDRYDCPDPATYKVDIAEDGTTTLNKMYRRHLDKYEKTHPWDFFLAQVERVCLEWIESYKVSKLKATLEGAIAQLSAYTSALRIDQWLGSMDKDAQSPYSTATDPGLGFGERPEVRFTPPAPPLFSTP